MNPLINSEKIQISQYGFVSLVDYLGSDITVVNAARVSFAKRKDVFDDKDAKLIKFLAEHNHWTPFAHPQITLHICAPIPIRTQMFKHKVGFTENEMSRRYVDTLPQIYEPKIWREKSENKKQGSGGTHKDNNDIKNVYSISVMLALSTYENLIESGVCPEQARFVLPQATMTEWYWTGSLAAYARFCKLRKSSDSQLEVQTYANAISSIIEKLYPVSWIALLPKSVV
jgi:thymidylate synthase (FAD)